MTAPFLIGSALVLGSFCSVGFFASSGRKRRLYHTEAALELIGRVRASIDCFLTPVNDIFAGFSNEPLEECGFLDVLREKGLTAAALSGTASFPEQVTELLVSFSTSLGEGYKEEQLKLCDFYGDAILKVLESERSEYEKDIRLYRFVPALLALFIILCFL